MWLSQVEWGLVTGLMGCLLRFRGVGGCRGLGGKGWGGLGELWGLAIEGVLEFGGLACI